MPNIPTTIVSAPDYLLGVEAGHPVLVPMNAGMSGGGSTGNLGPVAGVVDPATGVAAQASVSGGGGGRTCGTKMIIPSSGSIAANGALTLTTALPATFPQAYMYFPAGAVFLGAPAGMYYVVMTTSTLGTVYNNVYGSGYAEYPAAPVPVVAAGPGAYTQIAGASIPMMNITLPGGSLGKNGKLIVKRIGANAGGAASKIVSTFVAGAGVDGYTFTTSTAYRVVAEMQNAGSETAQLVNNFTGFGGQGGDNLNRRTINTSIDQMLSITAQMASATDYVTLESVEVSTVYQA